MADKTYGDLVWKISCLEEEKERLFSKIDKLEEELKVLKDEKVNLVSELSGLEDDSQFLKLREFYLSIRDYKEDGITHRFDCPCCGCKALVIKSALGVWAKCGGCRLEVQI